VTGTVYAHDRAERIWRKLGAGDLGRGSPEGLLLFEAAAFIPELRMLVQVFPHDRHLPSLPRLMAGPSPDVEPLLFAGFDAGGGRVDAWSIEPIQYRPGRAAVLRYRVQSRDLMISGAGTKCFYVKVYPDDGGERTYQVLRALWGRVDAGAAGFTVGRPIAYLSGLRALVQDEVLGTSLQQVLRHGGDALAAVRRVAQALAAFHLEEIPTPGHHRVEDEVAALKGAGELLQWGCPRLKAQVEGIVAGVVAGLEEVPPRPTHRELRTDHILFLDDGRLALIDLDSFARADPVLDPARVLAHLAGLSCRADLPDHGQWRLAARSFAKEYFLHVPGPWRSRLPLHYAGALLKEAVDFFRHQEPGWSGKVAALVEEAGHALSGEPP